SRGEGCLPHGSKETIARMRRETSPLFVLARNVSWNCSSTNLRATNGDGAARRLARRLGRAGRAAAQFLDRGRSGSRRAVATSVVLLVRCSQPGCHLVGALANLQRDVEGPTDGFVWRSTL